MNKSSADVEKDVEASRSALDRNVEALRDKMTPGQLLDEAMTTMGGAGQQIASKFIDQAKQNPMPLAVMGLGIAWLVASNRGPGSSGSAEPRSFADRTSRDPAADGSSGSIGDKVQAMGDMTKGLVDQASDTLATVHDKLGAGSDSVKDAVGGLSDKAGQLTQQAQQGVTQAFQKEPLLVGVLGFAAGLALGAALPPTEAEDRLLGPSRDRVLEEGKDLAQTGLARGTSAAKASYQGAKSELQSEGEGEMSDKLAAAVKTGVERAQDELKPH